MAEKIELGKSSYLGQMHEISGQKGKDFYNLFYLAFPYAQGNPLLQTDILEWTVREGYLEGITLHAYKPDSISNIAAPSKHYGEGQKSDSSRNLDLYRQWRALRYFLDGERTDILDEELISKIADGIITRDIHYQDNPRPNRPEVEVVIPDSKGDRHMSFIRRHMLGRFETGHSAFNRLFHEELPEILPFKPSFLELAHKWELNHEGKKFFS